MRRLPRLLILISLTTALLLSSCSEDTVQTTQSTTRTYPLRSADGHALPAFQYVLGLPDIDTGFVAVVGEGSLAVTTVEEHPELATLRLRFGYGYGIKYGAVLESAGKTYDRSVPYHDFTDTLATGYFPVIHSGDSLVVIMPLRHDDRTDLAITHSFRLVFR